MKCNKTQSKWCINKHGASKIIDTFETYHITSAFWHAFSLGTVLNVFAILSYQYIYDLLTLSKNMYTLLTLSPYSCLIVLSNIHAPSVLCHVEEQEALETLVNFQTLSLS
jgi:hypothetical protein